MELKAKTIYRCPQFTLYEGQTTDIFEISEEQKNQMLKDFPEIFEVVGAAKAIKATKKEDVVEEGEAVVTEVVTNKSEKGKK